VQEFTEIFKFLSFQVENDSLKRLKLDVESNSVKVRDQVLAFANVEVVDLHLDMLYFLQRVPRDMM
jgi:hypothetical protein